MQPQKRLFRNHLILSCLLTFLIIALVITCYHIRTLEKADLFLYDLHFRWRGPQPTSEKVVLVLMDQRSASELERRKGAWSRAHLASAIENLCRAGCAVIGLDMIFFAPSEDLAEDKTLAETIGECGNVVLGKFVAEEGRGEVSALPRFQEGMIGDGFINMFPDSDGVVRKMPFFSIKPVQDGVAISPSFSLEVVRAFLNLDFDLDFSHKDYFRLGAGGSDNLLLPYPDLRVHFYGGAEAFSRLSFVDAVSNRFHAETVRKKIVLIGSSLATDKDFFATPFAGYEGRAGAHAGRFGKVLEEDSASKTVGVAIHGHAIETILNGAFIQRFPERYVISLTVLCGLMGLIFYAQRPGPLGGILILLSSVGALLGISHFAFVRQLLWIEMAPLMAILSLQYVSGIALQRAYSRKKTRLVTNLFGKYVSQSVVKDIIEGSIGVALEGRAQELTVLFSDLRGFTTLSEGLSPQETGSLLNVYFDAMIPIVFDHQGTLDKLMGDAIMAFFGAPRELKDHPQKAAETALEMIHRLKALRKESSQKGIEKLEVGIGLNTGQVTVGNLGSQNFMEYTVIGDTVNLGSRLEGLNKVYGTSIIVGENTAKRLDSQFVLRELDLVKVKGKEDAVAIFELVGFRHEVEEERLKLIDHFHRGLQQYRNMEWAEAEKTFSEALNLFSADGPSRLYLERTQELLRCPPPPEWECVTKFTTK
jgi:adenylate cyclase